MHLGLYQHTLNSTKMVTSHSCTQKINLDSSHKQQPHSSFMCVRGQRVSREEGGQAVFVNDKLVKEFVGEGYDNNTLL